jgi:hypothetical protein
MVRPSVFAVFTLMINSNELAPPHAPPRTHSPAMATFLHGRAVCLDAGRIGRTAPRQFQKLLGISARTERNISQRKRGIGAHLAAKSALEKIKRPIAM